MNEDTEMSGQDPYRYNNGYNNGPGYNNGYNNGPAYYPPPGQNHDKKNSLLTVAIILGALAFAAIIALLVFLIMRDNTQPEQAASRVDTVVIEKQVGSLDPAPAASSSHVSYSVPNCEWTYLSNTRLSRSELYNYDCGTLRTMRNAIYAMHGYRFQSADLRSYFGAYSWYNPTTSSQSAAMSRMNSTEKANIRTITSVESARGCN